MEIKTKSENGAGEKLQELKRRNLKAWNAVTSYIVYGNKNVVVGGVVSKVPVDIFTDYEEVFDHEKLLSFLEHGVARDKDWVMVDGGNVREYGVRSGASIAMLYPGLVRNGSEKIYRVLLDLKKDLDNKYQNWKYESTLEESSIVRRGDTAIVKQQLGLKPRNKRKLGVYEALEEPGQLEIKKVLDGTLVGYTGMVVKGALYRKFLGDLKLSLWHFVDERDSGKTTWLEAVNENIEVYQEDNLQKIFGERAKVNVSELNNALILHQDETTVMFNDFKLLTNSTLKLSLAYAKKQTTIVAPLVVMTSHDDAMDTYSEQFQARVVKVYPGVGDIKGKLAELVQKGYSIEDIEAVTYVYIREIIQEEIRRAREEPAEVMSEVREFVLANKVESHDKLEIVRDEIRNFIGKIKTASGETGLLDRVELKKHGCEVLEKEGEAWLVVTGAKRMKGFISGLVQDKTIEYEISKGDYEDIGFVYHGTFSSSNGDRRQKCWAFCMNEEEEFPETQYKKGVENVLKSNEKRITEGDFNLPPAPPVI